MAMKLIVGAALLACTAVSTLATSSPTLAQGVYGARYYGYYDYAPVPFRQARRSHNFYGPVATPERSTAAAQARALGPAAAWELAHNASSAAGVNGAIEDLAPVEFPRMGVPQHATWSFRTRQ